MNSSLNRLRSDSKVEHLEDSVVRQYLSRMKTLSDIIWKNDGVRSAALVLDEEGQPLYYVGKAQKVRKLHLPLTKEAVT